MIVFDLRCGSGHVFEAWFGSSEDYDSQRARGLVSCPVCGHGTVEKAVMAPRINSGAAADERPVPVSAPAAPPAEVKAVMEAMAKLQAKLTENSEWVGRRFADEARAIHHGEADKRSIHGEATPTEAAQLADEGVEVMPLPFPFTPPEKRN